MRTWRAAAAAVVTVAALAGPAARAQSGGIDGDALTNPTLKGPEVIAFMQVKLGDKVADIVAGRFARALSVAVGPTGKVYAVEPAEVVRAHPFVLSMAQGLAAEPTYANVAVVEQPIDALALPAHLDAVFIRQNYHDLHDKFMGPADVALFNRHIFNALKPGGVFVVVDHAAAAGSGLRDTDTLHRIDPTTVTSEIEAAGFKLDATSTILANPSDDHTKAVFDPVVRGQTDQFLFRFRKPS